MKKKVKKKILDPISRYKKRVKKLKITLLDKQKSLDHYMYQYEKYDRLYKLEFSKNRNMRTVFSKMFVLIESFMKEKNIPSGLSKIINDELLKIRNEELNKKD